jgi:hypothetical protein
MSETAQETRSTMVAAKVTPTEKQRIDWVARVLNTNVSNLLRDMSVDAVLREHRRLVKVMEQAA